MIRIEVSKEALNLILPLFIAIVILSVLGCVGNIFLIIFFSKERRNNGTYILIMAIAVFDTLGLAMQLICIIIIQLIQADNPLISRIALNSYSILINYLSRLPKYFSNVILFILAIERFIGVAFPHKVKSYFTKKLCLILVVLLPLILTILLIPSAMEFEAITLFENSTGKTGNYILGASDFAVNNRRLYLIFNIIILTLAVCLPLLGITVCNLALAVLLYRKKTFHANLSTQNRIREMKATKIVIIITVIFILCASPLGIYVPLRNILQISLPANHTILVMFSIFLETINHSANGVVYFIQSYSFRDFVRRVIISKCRCARNKTVPVNEQNNIGTEQRVPGPSRKLEA